MWILWTVLAGIALVLDIITESFLFIWFTIGGMAALGTAIMNYGMIKQITVFVIVSIPLLFIRLFLSSVKEKNYADSELIGVELAVDDEMVDKGVVKLNGRKWTVKNLGEPVKIGDRIVVTFANGECLSVKRIENS